MSALQVSIAEATLFQALGDFIASVLPSTVDVARGQQNRKAEPSNDNYVVMWPLTRVRLSTNVDLFVDVAFLGSVSGIGTSAQVTVIQMLAGQVEAGLTLTGASIPAGIQLGQQQSGAPGGIGVYALTGAVGPLNIPQEVLQAGYAELTKPTQVDVQIDVHGPDSADNAEVIALLFRSSYGADAFSAEGAAIGINFAPGVSAIGSIDIAPLYCEDPKQLPYLNAEQQFEERWVVEVHLQANLAIRIPQQFASSLALTVTNLK